MIDTRSALNRHIRYSIAAILLLGGGALAASLFVPVAGAVLASGQVVVEHSLRKVQHATGGVVGKLLVSEGQKVRQGDLLVRLDDTSTRANLAIIVNEMTALMARRARLTAERDGRETMPLPDALAALAERDSDVQAMAQGECRLFEARRATRAGQKAQLRERIDQLKEEASGIALQLKSLADQRAVAEFELKDLQDLLQKNLIQRPRVTQIQREVIRIDGAIGEAQAKLAQTRGRTAEIELQMLQVDTDHVTEVSRDLREAETKIGELTERRIAAEDQLSRVDIRAPISGQVHQLTVHTVGGVVTPGETMMQVVPENERLVVEGKVSPNDIDEVRIGQEARIRFTAFNTATTPDISGVVTRVAGDLTREQQSGVSYYVLAVDITADQLDKLGALQLLPGMPAELHLKTGERTIGSFLLKPLMDHMRRSMREN